MTEEVSRSCSASCDTSCSGSSCSSTRSSTPLARTSSLSAYWLVHGSACAPLLHSDVGLSFWGGTDAMTGEVIDRHHPLSGQFLAGKILAIPSGRGSCTGSLALLELLVQGCGPAGIILEKTDEILALGGLVAKKIFSLDIPLIVISSKHFSRLSTGASVRIDKESSSLDIKSIGRTLHLPLADLPQSFDRSTLSHEDLATLAGERGEPSRQALEIVMSMAEMYGATSLINITRAHIDSCIYTGPASLRFAQHFADLQGAFQVPTTLNSISVDRNRWKDLGVEEELARKSNALADAYISMGASRDSLTCAPYLLEGAPSQGDQIVWGESNAVVYANSILGARTQKYPDLLEVSIALTGRAPLAGCHLDANRVPVMALNLSDSLRGITDSSFWPLLGYHVGSLAGNRIPIICGLEEENPLQSDLKAFGAAFATTSSSPMFHIHGLTPEASVGSIDLSSTAWRDRTSVISTGDLVSSWNRLNSARTKSVGLVSLGNPHFTLDEFEQLARLVSARKKHSSVSFIITSGREISRKAEKLGHLAPILEFGCTLMNDTCWCMITAPIIRKNVENLMTNSGKYAHYGPGLVGKGVHFGSLEECVEVACTGERELGGLPGYLRE